MSKAIFAAATWLYSVAAPDGRLFDKGAEHPGEGWFDHPSAVPAKAQGVASDSTGKTLQDHIDEALAEQAKKFDASWKDMTTKLDAARAEVDELTAENKDLRGEIVSKAEDIRQLEVKVKELEELIATVDGDGDGKPGGSTAKGDKAAK